MIDFLLFGGVPTPPSPLLDTLIETKIEIQVEPELTVQQKIDSNFYRCDESVEWIRADTAECKTKQVNIPVQAKNTPQPTKSSSGTVPGGWYDWGWCTYYVSTQRSVGRWGNASQWTWQAKRDGWATGTTPQAGAIGQKGNHVVVVRSVSGSSMTIEEMNYEGFGVISSRTVSSAGWNFIY